MIDEKRYGEYEQVNGGVANDLIDKIDIYEAALNWKYVRLQTVRGFPIMHKPMCQPNYATLCSCGLDRWKCDMDKPQHQTIKELIECDVVAEGSDDDILPRWTGRAHMAVVNDFRKGIKDLNEKIEILENVLKELDDDENWDGDVDVNQNYYEDWNRTETIRELIKEAFIEIKELKK